MRERKRVPGESVDARKAWSKFGCKEIVNGELELCVHGKLAEEESENRVDALVVGTQVN